MICPQFFFFSFYNIAASESSKINIWKIQPLHVNDFFVCLGKYDLLLSQMDQLDFEIENLIIEIPTVINEAKENIYEARKKENYALIGSAIGIATGYLMQVGLF